MTIQDHKITKELLNGRLNMTPHLSCNNAEFIHSTLPFPTLNINCYAAFLRMVDLIGNVRYFFHRCFPYIAVPPRGNTKLNGDNYFNEHY